MDTLHVLACVSNPVRWRSRADLARRFVAMCARAGVTLWLIEGAFGARPFDVLDPANPRHVGVRLHDELWHKENLLNALLARLPLDARYVAWVDADVDFVRPDWATETVHALQHYPVVQMWSEAHDLDPQGHSFARYRSAAHSHVHGIPRRVAGGAHGQYGGVGRGDDPGVTYYHHPGYAWAARREALDAVGGLFDVSPVGESDWLMFKGAHGEVEDVIAPGVSPGYLAAAQRWAARAAAWRRDIGYVPGSLTHNWHGRKEARGYWTRTRILTESQFDPATDLRRDTQGIYRLHDDGSLRATQLRDALRAYFRSRNEDGTDA